MDIGFVAMTPIIVGITGIDSPLTMAGLCALGYATGWSCATISGISSQFLPRNEFYATCQMLPGEH